MDGTLPNFKVGEPTSNILPKNNIMVLDDSDSSFVVLAKDVTGSLRDLKPNDEQVPQWTLDDRQSILSSVNDISRIENKLHEVLEENEKLKKTLEESDTVMKQQFEKIEVWQKEVMNVCRDHNQKYMESKELIDRMRAENELLRGAVQNKPTVSKPEDVVAESSSLNTSTYLSAAIDSERSIVQNDLLSKAIEISPIRTRDSSLDNNMTVISLKTDKTIQLPAAEMQSVSTESESVTAAVGTHQTPSTETQCESTATEMRSTDIHSSLSQSKSLSLADIENKLHNMLQEYKELRGQSEKLTARHMDVMSLCNDQSKKSVEKLADQLRANDCSSGITSKSDASHKEKGNLTQEQESPNKLKKLLSANHFSLRDMVQNRLQTCVFDDSDAESSTSTDSSITADEKYSLAHKDFYSKAARVLSSQRRALKNAKTTQTSAMETQCVSSETELVTACVETQTPATETQCASTETEIRSTDIATDTGFNTQTLDTVPQFTLAISECFEQIEGLEKNAKQFLESGNLKKYVDAYKEALKELNNCFSSMHSRCTEQQNIIAAVRQFHKLQSDFSFIMNELAIAMVEKDKGKTCDTVVVEKENAKLLVEKLTLVEQKISLMKEKALVHAKLEQIMTWIETLEQEQEKLSIERKGLQDMMREVGDRQEQSYAVEKSMLENEVFLLREKCAELTKKLDESNALNTLKEDLSQERESLEELKKLLDDEMKSHQERHEALTRENTLLKSKCDMLEADVKNFNTELIDSHKTITKLRKEITELREAADTLDVYKVQNNVQAKDILHMFETEQNYLEEIERLSNEIEKLQEANARLKTD